MTQIPGLVSVGDTLAKIADPALVLVLERVWLSSSHAHAAAHKAFAVTWPAALAAWH